jgi:hypothetical protein
MFQGQYPTISSNFDPLKFSLNTILTGFNMGQKCKDYKSGKLFLPLLFC